MEETQPKRLVGKPEDPEAQHWRNYAREGMYETPKRLEEAAKFLTGLIALTLTLSLDNDFLKKELYADGKAQVMDAWAQWCMKIGIGCWLLSVLAALFVIFPMPYAYASNSSASIQAMHRQVLRRKYAGLIAAAFFYLVALALVAFVRFR
jgi:hypothetical protein